MQTNGFNIRLSVRWLWYKYNLLRRINCMYDQWLTLKDLAIISVYTHIQKITTPRGYHYKIRMKIQEKNDQINKHCKLWIYLEVGLRSSQVVMGYSDVPGPNALLLTWWNEIVLKLLVACNGCIQIKKTLITFSNF